MYKIISHLIAANFFIACWISVVSASNLKCYQCTKFEIELGSSSLGQSDPSCGSWITDYNVVTCYSNQICGTVIGEVSARTFKAQIQSRGCMPIDTLSTKNFWGDCVKTSSFSNLGNGGELDWITKIPGFQFSGSLCTCNFDYCSLCDGGFNIGGYCMAYWVAVLISIGVLLLIIAMVTCCCCGCCRCCCSNGSPGVIHSPPYHTFTLVTPHATGPTPTSGDTFQSINQNSVGGAYPSKLWH